jgi:hypothetical protein
MWSFSSQPDRSNESGAMSALRLALEKVGLTTKHRTPLCAIDVPLSSLWMHSLNAGGWTLKPLTNTNASGAPSGSNRRPTD